MSRYLLDTNIISDLIRNPNATARQRLFQVGDEDVCTSIIVAAELYYGCAKQGSERLSKRVAEVLTTIPVYRWNTQRLLFTARSGRLWKRTVEQLVAMICSLLHTHLQATRYW